ncbi:MAG TPA: nucleotidyltransferase domain-containing protein, partial [Pyrodictium sp.]|nr:nucleotidyltransferase domain-containing protein [Pyrodictium sp.]
MRQTVLKRLRERLRKLDRIFEEYISLLSRTYPESTILLFGSRARGNNLPYSDYDLMI